MTIRFSLALAAALALTACNDDAKRETGGRAAGEILPGTASDAMLPYDTVRSQPPLAEGAEKGKDTAKGKDAAKSDGTKPAPASQAPAPASTSEATDPEPEAAD